MFFLQDNGFDRKWINAAGICYHWRKPVLFAWLLPALGGVTAYAWLSGDFRFYLYILLVLTFIGIPFLLLFLGMAGQSLQKRIDRLEEQKKAVEMKQGQQKKGFLMLMEGTEEGILGVDNKGICTFVNPAALRMLGYKEEELVGQSVHEKMHHSHPDGRFYPKEECSVRLASQAGIPHHSDDEYHWRKDGTGFPVEFWSHPIHENGELIGTVLNFVDISRRREMLDELLTSEEKFSKAFRAAPNAIIIVQNTDGQILEVNEGFENISGLAASDVLGKSVHDIELWGDSEEREKFLGIVQSSCSWKEQEIKFRTPQGEIKITQTSAEPVTIDNQECMVIFAHDVTLLRKAELLKYRADHDELTGLPNRSLLQDRLENAITLNHRDNSNGALLFLDLDRFKQVNDRWGHQYGDDLLVDVTARLKSLIEDHDTLARVGGDEFVIVMPRLGHAGQAENLADEIIKTLQEPFDLHGETVSIGVSIGIAGFPQNGCGMEKLMEYADKAMYDAKQAGRDCYRVYSASTFKGK